MLSSSYEIYKDSRKENEPSVATSKPTNETKNSAERPENTVPQVKEPVKEPTNHAQPQK